jgi:beta-mannosidase
MPSMRYLHDGWTLQPVDSATDVPQVPATVPGCVHTDLQAAGVIPDPYLDRNEHELRWIGESGWRYTTTFSWSADTDTERVDLVCEGLDTIAIRDGENELAVRFGSPVHYARQMYDSHGRLPKHQPASAEPFNYIRKMSSDFGWDWGPVLPTSGIWKPIALHTWKTARLARVRPLVTTADGAGRVEIEIDLERTQTRDPLRLEARIAGTGTGTHSSVDVPAEATTATIELEVADPDLWWPHTHGDQPLYDLRVECWHGDDRLDEWHRRIGFRTVEIDTSPDEIGSAFTIVVNGRPIFARGANWAPDDCFPSRVDAARYQGRLQQAKDAHIDLFRINGVGLYEQDALYDAADELGILIWQDFTLSCATYPEEEPYLQEIEAEARENVARLMPHPSLILWNGTNENLWGYYDWRWRDQLGDRPWGKRYYFEVFPRVVAEVDPTRPYWPGSPYSGAFERHPNLPEHGTTHDWDPWTATGP